MFARDITFASSGTWHPRWRWGWGCSAVLSLVMAKAARIVFCHYLGRKYCTISLEITLGFWIAHIKLLTSGWHIVDLNYPFYYLDAATNPHRYGLLWWWWWWWWLLLFSRAFCLYLAQHSKLFGSFWISESEPVSLVSFHFVLLDNWAYILYPIFRLIYWAIQGHRWSPDCDTISAKVI